MIDLDASFEFSPVISIEVRSNNSDFVRPTLIQNGQLELWLSEPWEKLELISGNGAILFEKDLGGQTGRISFNISQFPKAVYIVRIRNKTVTRTQKILIAH
jgi:hypothetical protein